MGGWQSFVRMLFIILHVKSRFSLFHEAFLKTPVSIFIGLLFCRGINSASSQ